MTYALASSSEKLPGYGICDGHLDLRLYQKGFWMAYTGNELKTHVSELLGISGTYLLVGIGAHDHYNHKKVINKYLKPSFDLIKGHNWPKVCFNFSSNSLGNFRTLNFKLFKFFCKNFFLAFC